MPSQKTPWNRAEKWLLATPLLFALGVGMLWMWRRSQPASIDLPDRSSIRSFRFSPDGKRLAVIFEMNSSWTTTTYSATNTVTTGGALTPGSIVGGIYDIESHQQLCPLVAPTPLHSARPYFYEPSWSPDGTRLVAGYEDQTLGTKKIPNPPRPVGYRAKWPKFHFNWIGKVQVWNTQTGRQIANFGIGPANEETSGRIRFSDDGYSLICDGKPPSRLNSQTGQRIKVWDNRATNVVNAAFNEKLGLAAFLTKGNRHFKVVDLQTGAVALEGQGQGIVPFRWGGDILAVVGHTDSSISSTINTNSLLVWDGKTRRLLHSPQPPKVKSNLDEFAVNPIEPRVAVAYLKTAKAPRTSSDFQSDLSVWDCQTGRVLWRYSPKRWIHWALWSPDGKWLSVTINGAPNKPMHLLVFDNKGTLTLNHEVGSEQHRWSPDSQQIAVVSAEPFPTQRIELVRVDG